MSSCTSQHLWFLSFTLEEYRSKTTKTWWMQQCRYFFPLLSYMQPNNHLFSSSKAAISDLWKEQLLEVLSKLLYINERLKLHSCSFGLKIYELYFLLDFRVLVRGGKGESPNQNPSMGKERGESSSSSILTSAEQYNRWLLILIYCDFLFVCLL